LELFGSSDAERSCSANELAFTLSAVSTAAAGGRKGGAGGRKGGPRMSYGSSMERGVKNALWLYGRGGITSNWLTAYLI